MIKQVAFQMDITWFKYLFPNAFPNAFPDAFPLPKRYQVAQISAIWLRAFVAL